MGGRKEPEITQAPTKSPQQMQFLESLLSFFPEAMSGFTIGETYGGPSQATQTHTIGQGKGGTAPTARPRDRRNPRGTPLDAALTEPIVGPSRQLQTGNSPRRGGG